MLTLTCGKCFIKKPIEAFCRSSSRSSGRSLYCRICESDAVRQTCKTCTKNLPASKFVSGRFNCKACDIAAGMQYCGKCQQMKPLDQFYRNKQRRVGYHIHCKMCCKPSLATAAAWRRKTRFGLTSNDHAALLQTQRGVCAVCGRPERRKRLGKTLSLQVDHDHKSGRVRGLLCTDCNLGIGRFLDNPELLRAAARYLEERHERHPADR